MRAAVGLRSKALPAKRCVNQRDTLYSVSRAAGKIERRMPPLPTGDT
jgi:hypothetical protein